MIVLKSRDELTEKMTDEGENILYKPHVTAVTCFKLFGLYHCGVT